ncbi:MAG TPA: hypothetical protein VM030_00515 [Acidimicrobiales bacterium]|nr:hypothetical protein [Acidimicrobiales bacterium]
MDQWRQMTLGDVAAGLRRYQPFIAAVVAVVLVVAFLPGERQATDTLDTAAGDTGAVIAADGSVVAPGDTVAGGEPGTTTGAGPGVTVGAGGGPATGGGGRRATIGGNASTGNAPLPVTGKVGPDCDPATGRIRVPTRYAPPCMPVYTSANNGGSTYQGVTKDTITVVWYRPKVDPAVDAALTAAGANNRPEDVKATFMDYINYFNDHYDFHGRKIKIIEFNGTGDTADDATSRADAIKVATEYKAFASIGAPTSNAYVNELVARKVVCVCTTSQPVDFYTQRAPYVWGGTLMASNQGYVHRAEYIGKRLKDRPAKYAGDAAMTTQKRVFGVLYYETPEKAYKPGIDYFERTLKEKWGVQLKTRLEYSSKLAEAQEQSTTLIAKLKSDGVTSVIFAGDFITPAIWTSEATKQNYHPEWIITGSALTDTTLFARTYDRTQWSHAFGVSYLPARVVQQEAEAYKLHVWAYNRPPTADNQYGVIYSNPFIMATAIHMAGPNLNPFTVRDGLWRYPPTGQGFVTTSFSSWGRHGIWEWDDYVQYDDTTEIWWDPNAQGPDEVGNEGVGMYRYVEGGKRYLPGEWPTSEVKPFVTDGTVTMYTKRPPQETPPEYPHQKWH